MENEHARLVKFTVNNMMAVRFAEVEFDEKDSLVMITGANGSGKSSLIQALQFAFGGKKAVDKDVLRYGADMGFVNVTLGGREFQIRRTINDKGRETLTVKGADGKSIKSPQTVLNELIGVVGIDPSLIFGMSDAKVSETLREVMGLDLTELDAKEKDLADRRAVANKAVKSAVAVLEDAETFDGVPERKESMTALMDEFKAAGQEHRETEEAQQAIDMSEKKKDELAKKIEDLERQVEGYRHDYIQCEGAIIKNKAFLESPRKLDFEDIQRRIETMEKTNEKVEANQRAAVLEANVGKEKGQAAELDKTIELVRQQRRDLIASADFPLDGVQFDGDGKLILDGKPWRAWSDGERLTASFEIAAALSPNLQAVVMRQGAMLDDENRKLIADIATERGYLVLMEIVGDSGEVHLVMDDGQVKDCR